MWTRRELGPQQGEVLKKRGQADQFFMLFKFQAINICNSEGEEGPSKREERAQNADLPCFHRHPVPGAF